jgi:hypothetical protein
LSMGSLREKWCNDQDQQNFMEGSHIITFFMAYCI